MNTIALLFLVAFMVIVYICWNCRVRKSTVVLITILGLAIYIMSYPKEQFQTEPVPAPAPFALTSKMLELAGISRPSVFNCASTIGNTSETDPRVTDPTLDM